MPSQKEPTGIRLDATVGGKDVTIFSGDGSKKTESDFSSALQQYAETGQAPDGYTIAEPGSFIHNLRSNIADKASSIGTVGKLVGTAAATSPALLIAQKLGIVPSGTQEDIASTGMNVGGKVGEAVGSTVNTPEKLAATVGTVVGAKLASPSTFINSMGEAGLAKGALLGNMLKTGGAAALFGQAGRMMGGEAPTPGSALVQDFIPAAIGQGFQGVLDTFITKYLSPNQAEEVARGVLGQVADAYPGYRNDPNIISAAVSSREGLQNAVKKMSEGLRGTVQDISDNISTTLMQTLPRTLSVGEQATLRAGLRDFVRKGNNVLDNINDAEALTKAQDALRQSGQKVVDFIQETFTDKAGKSLITQGNLDRVGNIIQAQKDQLEHFNEGAQVLSYLRQSGAHEGFNPVAFADTIMGRDVPGTLLGRVGRELGFGANLERGVGRSPAQHAADFATGLAGMVPGKVGMLGKVLGAVRGRTPQATLPWQYSRATGPLTTTTAEMAVKGGQDAIKDFVGR